MTDLRENMNAVRSEEEPIETDNKSEKFGHRDPFEFMRIDDNTFLYDMDSRSPCPKCSKSRKFFCYTCYVPVQDLENRLPKVELPLKIDIIKHQREIDGKSTAIHAAILAADNVNIYTYPDIPDYSPDDETVLIFPTHNSIHVDGIFDNHVRLQTFDDLNLPRGINQTTLLKHRLTEVMNEKEPNGRRKHFTYNLENLPIKKAVFIDSTWNQCKSIFNDKRVNCLRTVVLQNRLSQFWRHQRGSPRWYLATIEAIHQFLLEVHINAWGLDHSYKAFGPLEMQTDFIRDDMIIKIEQQNESESSSNNGSMTICSPYCGQYDNLFFFFTYMYHLIHTFYDHNVLKAYRRPVL
ncbi:DTW domain-containing protein 1 [Contarinia nasturtii]|uniref:DTW domain-containing protein 1 n=1 Tax=Contarinia nasturtii TaxID=265458 RepID=UPI0012D4549E|nr:DTW domain-containing protein 1 [Contarinia nasturtii]